MTCKCFKKKKTNLNDTGTILQLYFNRKNQNILKTFFFISLYSHNYLKLKIQMLLICMYIIYTIVNIKIVYI